MSKEKPKLFLREEEKANRDKLLFGGEKFGHPLEKKD